MRERARRLGDDLTMEHALLALFIVTSAYMFVDAFEFSYEAQIFPQFTAGTVVVLGMMLLFRDYMPGPLQQLVSDEVEVFEHQEDLESDGEEPEPDDEKGTVQYGAAITGGLCVGYLVTSYLFGMLWMTPLFVFAYTYWTRQPWLYIIGLSVLSFAIAFLFYWVLLLPVDMGLLHEVLQ
jgi:hypothetical protein